MTTTITTTTVPSRDLQAPILLGEAEMDAVSGGLIGLLALLAAVTGLGSSLAYGPQAGANLGDAACWVTNCTGRGRGN
jgi:hypothetical protein